MSYRAVVRRWGWRAYALPVLSVVTVVALVQQGPGRSAAAPQAAARAATTPVTTPVTGHVTVEGATGGAAGFAQGVTPAPVVVDLGDDGVSCAGAAYPRLVLVSISRQHLWVCLDGKQILDTAVTTGATVDHDQTPLGSWRVQAKQRDRYLVGPGYRDYVHYWVPFNGDFGLHDAPWQTMAFGSSGWPTGGSHGCVHVPTAAMAWLYQWVDVGGTVVTVEA